jgi:pyruvate dehydrogenase E1 component alpha subunit/2-oxoisovalerate dehydrogenase E1 component
MTPLNRQDQNRHTARHNLLTDFSLLYRSLYLIRRFEETVIEYFPRGVFFGTTHTYLGQEADAVGVLSHLRLDGGDAGGVCGGRGGSQHLQWRNFYSNGIQGGIVPIATGMALAEKRKQTGAIVVVFLGDGTLGEGVVYESLNLASLWSAPILYVVENNCIAQTTPIELAVTGSIPSRFEAFDIPAVELDSSDVLEILDIAGSLMEDVRARSAPRALILHTCRFGPHSKGDDTREPDQVARLRRERDPLGIHAPRLAPDSRTAIESEVNTQIAQAFQQALSDPFPTLS